MVGFNAASIGPFIKDSLLDITDESVLTLKE